MADYDPNALPPYAVPPPTAEWGEPWAWLPPLVPPALPVDTVLRPPRGSNERQPGEPPSPPPPEPPPEPAPQQVGFVPVPAAAAAGGEVAPPPEPANTPAWVTPPGPGAGILPDGAPAAAADPFAAVQQVTDIATAEADKVRQQRAWAPFVTEALDEPVDNFKHWLGTSVGAKVYDTSPEVLQQARTAQRAAMYAADPDTLAIVDAKRELAAEDEAETKRLAAAKENRERAEREEATWRAAKLRADDNLVKREAEAKAIAESGWSDGSTGKLIAGLLGAVAGAIFQVRNGGPNLALQAMERAIDQDVAMARDKMAVAQQRHGADLAQADQDLQTETSFRLAAYDRINEQILAEQQQYDPNGRRASLLGHMALAVQARKQQVARQAYDQDLKDQIALLELQGKGLENVGKGLANEKALRKLTGIGAGAAAGSDKEILTPEQWRAELPPGAPIPLVPTSRKDMRAWMLTQKTANEVVATSREGGVSDEQRKRLVGDLKQPDGSPFLANGSEGDITVLNKRYQAAHTVARAIDNVLALRTGWTSDYVKSAEWQRVKQEFTTAIGVAKDVLGLGALSGPDMDLVKDFLGGTDPTGMRDPAPGLRQARESVLNLVRDNLKGAGYKEPGRFAIPNLADLKPREKTPGEEQLDANLRWQTNPYAIGDTAESIASYGGTHTPESIRADQRGFSDGQKIYAESLAKTIKDPNATPADKDTARARLKEIETKASSQGYRAFAKSLTAEKKFDILNPPAPHDADYQAFKAWYQKTYDRPFLDDREFPTIRPEGQ